MSTAFPAKLATHLARSLRTTRRRYRKRLARCQEKFSEGSVHDLRIETRRLLAMLDLLRALQLGESLKKTRKIFKKRLDAFDDLRDTQVQLLLLKPLKRSFPEADELESFLRRCERRIIGRLRHDIKATKQARLERRLKNLEKQLCKSADGPSRQTGVRPASAALRKVFRRVVKLRRWVRRTDTETIHRMRVAFKQFRYLSELLRPILPGLTTKQLNRMREYQTLMGDIQDIEVLITGLKRAVEAEALPVRSTHRLRDGLLRRRRKLIDIFMAAVDGLFEFQPDGLKRQPKAKSGLVRE
jgi:CHAD domain-containing protein